jgi:hypothetical protein
MRRRAIGEGPGHERTDVAAEVRPRTYRRKEAREAKRATDRDLRVELRGFNTDRGGCSLSKAAELIFTGDTYDAVSAQSMGLVSQVVTSDQLIPTAQALAERIVCNPARTLRLAKRLLREGQQQRLADVLELSAAFQALAHETEDHREAVDAFLQKRTPRFRGA